MKLKQSSMLKRKQKAPKEFYAYFIGNIIVDKHRLQQGKNYKLVRIINETIVPANALLTSIKCVDDAVTLIFESKNGDNITIQTNLASDEERDWYILDGRNYADFLKMYNDFNKR